jgi:hypothetical protein
VLAAGGLQLAQDGRRGLVEREGGHERVETS